MSCIKTGFHAYLTPDQIWLYGDAFELAGVTYFRICHIDLEPIRKVKHFTINNYSSWFDEMLTSPRQNSTMICASHSVINHGYSGIPV